MAPDARPLEGLPLINRALTVLPGSPFEKVAVNDLARVQIATGEIEALHADVNKLMADYVERARESSRSRANDSRAA